MRYRWLVIAAVIGMLVSACGGSEAEPTISTSSTIADVVPDVVDHGPFVGDDPDGVIVDSDL